MFHGTLVLADLVKMGWNTLLRHYSVPAGILYRSEVVKEDHLTGDVTSSSSKGKKGFP